MPDFVMSVASFTMGLPARFDGCSDPEGAIAGNGGHRFLTKRSYIGRARSVNHFGQT
jgi:hypothetical protein